jgi:hypothetical protein
MKKLKLKNYVTHRVQKTRYKFLKHQLQLKSKRISKKLLKHDAAPSFKHLLMSFSSSLLLFVSHRPSIPDIVVFPSFRLSLGPRARFKLALSTFKVRPYFSPFSPAPCSVKSNLQNNQTMPLN